MITIKNRFIPATLYNRCVGTFHLVSRTRTRCGCSLPRTTHTVLQREDGVSHEWVYFSSFLAL